MARNQIPSRSPRTKRHPNKVADSWQAAREQAPEGQVAECPAEGTPVSDEQLCMFVSRALHDSGHIPLRKVRVLARQGQIRLKGHVSTYFLKQMAQATTLAVAGVHSLQNDLIVS